METPSSFQSKQEYIASLEPTSYSLFEACYVPSLDHRHTVVDWMIEVYNTWLFSYYELRDHSILDLAITLLDDYVRSLEVSMPNPGLLQYFAVASFDLITSTYAKNIDETNFSMPINNWVDCCCDPATSITIQQKIEDNIRGCISILSKFLQQRNRQTFSVPQEFKGVETDDQQYQRLTKYNRILDILHLDKRTFSLDLQLKYSVASYGTQFTETKVEDKNFEMIQAIWEMISSSI